MAIKVYRNTDAGAPVLTGFAGSLVTVLDAVLVNGYNTVNVTSITRSSSTATVVCATPHGLSTGDSATISGATQADYNIDALVTVVDATTFTFAVANAPASPATGTITAKRSSAGFTKAFSGTNKAVYRANDVSGLRHCLRVLDDGGTSGGGGEARVFGYETMTDVDTGTGLYPTNAQSSNNGYFWRKSSTTDSTARPWLIVTDGKLIYYFNDYAGTAVNGMGNGYLHTGAFGDVMSYKPGDAYASIITGNSATNQTTSVSSGLFNPQTAIASPTSFASSMCIARDYTAVAGSRYVGLYGTGLSTGCIGATAAISYPHLIDSGFYLAPILVTQSSPALIRGRLPGAYEPMHGRCFNNGDTVSNVQGMPGKTFMMLYGTAGSSQGAMMIDITGPWDS